MSLIAHYRLNGNADDALGWFSGTVTGSVNFINGKLGEAFSTDADSGRVFTNIPDSTFKASFSASAWVRVKQWGLAQGVFGTRNSPNGWMLYRNAGNPHGLLRFYMHYRNQNGTNSTASHTYSGFPTNEWFHVVVVRGDGWFATWFNGTRVGYTEVGSSFAEWNSNGNNMGIGSGGGSGWTTSQMDIDDVRVYDHGLSLREIKDSYQGKVAHFKFDQFSEPTENLLTVPLDPTSWVHYDNPDFGFVSDEYFTYNGKLGIGPNVPAYRRTVSGTSWRSTRFDVPWTAHNDADLNKPLTTSIYVRCLNPSDNTRFNLNFQGTDSDGNRIDTSTQIPVGSDWVRIDNTRILADHGFVGLITRMKHYFRGDSVDRTWEVMMPQVEQKSGPTPFVEDSRQGFITDASNQGNDTEIALATSPQWKEEDGRKYYNFQQGDRLQVDPFVFGASNQVTVSAWIKPEPSDQRAPIVRIHRWYFQFFENNNLATYWYGRSPAGYHYSPTNSVPYNIWTHVAVVWTETDITFYVNGIATNTITSVGGTGDINSWLNIGYETTGRRFKGGISDVRVYSEALSESEIKEIYQQRASLDDHGNLHTLQINNVLNYDEAIGTSNLVLNANGELGDNTNFENFQYLGDGVFSRTSGSSTILHNDFIPIKGNGIDRFEPYILEGEVRGQDAQSRYYFMIACYNKFKQRINNEHMNFYSGTDTTLSQPLNAGDTWAYFNDVSGWVDSGTGSYINGMSFAYWLDSFDPIFVPLKYSRTHVRYLEVDTTNNRIRLQNTWSGDSLPAGTLAINSRSGGTYSYIAASNDLTLLGEWDYKESGPTSTTPVTGSMRFATEYVRIGWLMNRNSTDGTPTTQIKNIKFHAVKKDQNPTWISNGAGNEFKMQDFSEIGVANGLVAWYPLKSDVNDYAGGRNSVNYGATPTSGGYEFNGVDDYLEIAPSNINFASSGWTVSGVFETRDVSITQNFFGNDGRVANINWCSIHDGRLALWIHQDSEPNRGWYYGDTSLTANRVYHFSLVYDGRGNYQYFLDGSPDSSWPTFNTELDDCIIRYVGIYEGVGRYFNGILRDIRVYEHALSPEEVAINAKHSLNNNNTKMSLTSDNVYIDGQFSEV